MILEEAQQNELSNQITASIDAGVLSPLGNAELRFENHTVSPAAVVATVVLQLPSFTNSIGGGIFLQGVPPNGNGLADLSAVGGFVDFFSVYNRDGVKQFQSSVDILGASPKKHGNIDAPTTVIPAGQQVQINFFQINTLTGP